MKFILAICFIFLDLVIFSCKKKENPDNSFNIFTIEDDKNLGKQVSDEIANNPTTYPLLDETQYSTSYDHLRRITNTILNSGKLNYKKEFVWQTKIIKDDSTQNAFCTPGGYIYVYTGLIKYLDNEDDLAGVMGHEIAHADRRHSTDQLTEQYGLQMLLDIVLGKGNETVKQIALGITALKYSRKRESEADEYSVIFLSGTSYKCDGAANFFEKLVKSGIECGDVGEFFSTHPCPDNRIQALHDKAKSVGCNTTPISNAQYIEFKNSLP